MKSEIQTISRRRFTAALAAVAASAAIARSGKIFAERVPIRVAVSLETLAGANVNDARAAYRIWGEQVASSLALRHAEMLDQVFIPSADLIHMIRAGSVDCFALVAYEYASVMDLVDPASAIVEDYALDGMDYVLLVSAGSSFQKIEDLKGTRLLVHHHRDSSMLRTWLSLALAASGRPEVEQFFELIEMRDQVAQVILPVFFHKSEAAVLTRRAFNMAVELNPQLGKSLRVLASSPRIIPDGFWFRNDCNPEDKQAFQHAMTQLATVPSGRQVLALYQTTGFSQRPCTIMNSTVDMIRQYERIRKRGVTPARNSGQAPAGQ